MSTFQRITGIIAFMALGILVMVIITYWLVAIGYISENDSSTWSEIVIFFANPVGIIGLLIVMIGSATLSIRAK